MQSLQQLVTFTRFIHVDLNCPFSDETIGSCDPPLIQLYKVHDQTFEYAFLFLKKCSKNLKPFISSRI